MRQNYSYLFFDEFFPFFNYKGCFAQSTLNLFEIIKAKVRVEVGIRVRVGVEVETIM